MKKSLKVRLPLGSKYYYIGHCLKENAPKDLLEVRLTTDLGFDSDDKKFQKGNYFATGKDAAACIKEYEELLKLEKEAKRQYADSPRSPRDSMAIAAVAVGEIKEKIKL